MVRRLNELSELQRRIDAGEDSQQDYTHMNEPSLFNMKSFDIKDYEKEKKEI